MKKLVLDKEILREGRRSGVRTVPPIWLGADCCRSGTPLGRRSWQSLTYSQQPTSYPQSQQPELFRAVQSSATNIPAGPSRPIKARPRL